MRSVHWCVYGILRFVSEKAISLEGTRMKGLSGILLVMALLALTLPCTAQDPIPFNELARQSNASFSYEDMRADYDGQTASSTQMYPHRHWTTPGKIYTLIGLSLTGGGADLIYQTKHGCHPNSIDVNGDGCKLVNALAVAMEVSITFPWPILTVYGATRRSTEWLPYPGKKPAGN